MLNVYATQEFNLQIEQLEKEKAALQSKYNKLNHRLSRIEASLEQ
jgi:prefoldin subunit 5